MASFGADVLGTTLSGVINGFIERRRINAWATLIIELGAALVIVGPLAFGAVLLNTRDWVQAFGYGAMSAGASAGAVWTFSPLTKGMSIFIPRKYIEQAAVDPNLDMHEAKGGQKQ